MCGIVAAVAERNVVPILLEGLKRLEYRGYDSAGLAVCVQGEIQRVRTLGKVVNLERQSEVLQLKGATGIAHTRWATHGVPSEANAHPHMSGGDIALVHNGIIENYQEIRTEMEALGYVFTSQTDSEALVHLLHHYYDGDLRLALERACLKIRGAYAVVVMHRNHPDELVAVRHGSPLLLGIGIGEHFLASDAFALLPVTQRFIYLQEDDIAVIHRASYAIYAQGDLVERPVVESAQEGDHSGKDGYKHFMQKEIFEQPRAIADTLEGRVHHGVLQDLSFSDDFLALFAKVRAIHIVACGTSYHAGLAMRYRFEALGYPTMVELASEYLYREVAVPQATLYLTLSQSGETADTLEALKKAQKSEKYLDFLAICNVPESALVRQSHHHILTRAGREIGVASTKAFTTQLAALHLVAALLAKEKQNKALLALESLPRKIEEIFKLEDKIASVAKRLEHAKGCLFLGRGALSAIADEGALKLKELTYIHAESYAAGELKHGPLALVDEFMPVLALVEDNHLASKMISNLQEVQARGGQLIIFADSRVDLSAFKTAEVIDLGILPEAAAEIAFIVPLQLLAYHVALLKGTDVDQPRNLAKSVTVE